MGRPIERIETPVGDPAWRVSGHAEARILLTDVRLGSSRSVSAAAARSSGAVRTRAVGGSEVEYTAHAWWRKAMNKVFSAQNFERMTPTIRTVADSLADDLAAQPTPADVNENYSIPLTSRVMCALLGVPTEDIVRFRQWSAWEQQAAAGGDSTSWMTPLMSYAEQLVRQRRERPGDDVVSVLLSAGTGSVKRHETRVVNLLAGMLAFGRQTPASVISWGAMLLLTNPEQRRLLQADPSLGPRAVEEVLRLSRLPTAMAAGIHRYAYADIELGEVTIRAGDRLLLDLTAANHDDRVFAEPERFDITRDPNPHLTFGHGFYMCNFARLARAQIGIGLTTLFDRFPTLRLHEPPGGPELGDHLRTGGAAELAVAW